MNTFEVLIASHKTVSCEKVFSLPLSAGFAAFAREDKNPRLPSDVNKSTDRKSTVCTGLTYQICLTFDRTRVRT